MKAMSWEQGLQNHTAISLLNRVVPGPDKRPGNLEEIKSRSWTRWFGDFESQKFMSYAWVNPTWKQGRILPFPPMKSYTGPDLIFLDWWQSSIFITTMETTKPFRGQEIRTEMKNQPTEVRVELKRLLTTLSPSLSFRIHWFLTSSNSCGSLDSSLVLTLGCFK